MTVPPKIWSAVFERDKGYCQYCGVDLLNSFSTYCSATVDHLVARSLNGPDTEDNLVLACPACNSMLSRCNELTKFAERKAYLQDRQAQGTVYYLEWVTALRKKDEVENVHSAAQFIES